MNESIVFIFYKISGDFIISNFLKTFNVYAIDLLFWPVCLQICSAKSREILKFTPLNRVNFREMAFSKTSTVASDKKGIKTQ